MAVMSEVLPIILWTWVGTPIASIGVVVALMLADTQWGRAQEWRQGACGEDRRHHCGGVREDQAELMAAMPLLGVYSASCLITTD